MPDINYWLQRKYEVADREAGAKQTAASAAAANYDPLAADKARALEASSRAETIRANAAADQSLAQQDLANAQTRALKWGLATDPLASLTAQRANGGGLPAPAPAPTAAPAVGLPRPSGVSTPMSGGDVSPLDRAWSMFRFAGGTERVPAPRYEQRIPNPVTPPPAPLPAKPVQGPQTLSQVAKGTAAEPFVPIAEGVDSVKGFMRQLDDAAKWLGFACGTERVPHMVSGATRVPGKGSPAVDSVPAVLAPNEAVLNAPAADMLGRGLIAALNKVGAQKLGLV